VPLNLDRRLSVFRTRLAGPNIIMVRIKSAFGVKRFRSTDDDDDHFIIYAEHVVVENKNVSHSNVM